MLKFTTLILLKYLFHTGFSKVLYSGVITLKSDACCWALNCESLLCIVDDIFGTETSDVKDKRTNQTSESYNVINELIGLEWIIETKGKQLVFPLTIDESLELMGRI
jgi:hypothetical protein